MSYIKHKHLVPEYIGKKYGKQEVLGYGEVLVRPTTGKPVWTIKVKCTHPDGYWHIYDRPGSTFMKNAVKLGDKYEALCRDLNSWKNEEREHEKWLDRNPQLPRKSLNDMWSFLYQRWDKELRI